MNKNFKVALVAFILSGLYMSLSYIYFKNSSATLYAVKYNEVAERMKRELEVLIKEKREAILILDISLAQNEKIKKYLVNKDTNRLDLKEYSDLLQKNTSLKNVWFHIVDKEGYSRYRSWTDKKGDNVKNVRLEVQRMLENPRLISTISTGIYDMTFKSMFPIYKDDEFIGIAETIARFNSIVQKLKEYSFETIVLIDKSYKKQLTNTLHKNYIQDYYVSSYSGSQKLLELVREKGVDKFLNIDTYMVDKQRGQLVTLYKLPGVDGLNMGYFIISKDLDKIDTNAIEDSKERIMLGLIMGFLIIGGSLSYLYVVNYKNYIQRQQLLLEKNIAEKTQELQEKSEAMTHLAHHDSLTNLPNRLYFQKQLDLAIESASRSAHKVGVLFLDLDSFKEINDTYGHRVGDMLLQKITEKMRRVADEEDVVARIGGDEFTVIANKVTPESLEKIAVNIMNEIQKPIKLDAIELFVTFSIGVSIYPDDGDTPELLLKFADTAMYRAKELGKNGYQFYNESMTEMAVHKVEMQNALREAIKEEQFEPYFQPKIDARTMEVIGVEALVRWNHPQRGLIFPGEFIPFAEESGAILEIDRLVMKKALKEMKLWYIEGLPMGRLSLNISGKQFENSNFIQEIEQTIASLKFDTNYLEFEVTESQILQNQKKAAEILTKFKSLGIKISLDDFGTGYSSLSYLKSLPVDRLKIDRSFIMDIPDDKDDVAIVKTIISLAKNLELDVIAEGVETQEQVDMLLKEGCNFIQGYYFAKPMNAKDTRSFVFKRV